MRVMNDRAFPPGRQVGGQAMPVQYRNREIYVTKEEVAKRLMKTARTIERWQRLGYIPFVKVGQAVLYKWADVEERLDQKFGSQRPKR